MTDFDLDIPEIHFPDTIELDDDIDFSVADFSIVDEEEQTRIIKPKMVKKGRRRKYSSRFKLNRKTGEITNEKRSTRV